MSKTRVVRKALGKKKKAVRKPRKASTVDTTRKSTSSSSGKSYETEGARKASDTGGSVDTSRAIDAGRSGKVTRGSASYTNFIRDQLAISPGERAKSKVRKDFYKQINRAVADGDEATEKKLRDALAKIEAKYEKDAVKATRSARAKASASLRGRKKEVDHYGKALKDAVEDGVIESEHTKNLTPRQMDQILKAARNAKKPTGRRVAETGMEEAKRKPGDSAVGRRRGTRGMASGIRAEDRAGNKDPISRAKGGSVTKKATGAHDYRMNNGGLLLSSVDRRKKK